MKKFACLLIALLLCCTAVATAEYVPSKTVANLTQIETSNGVYIAVNADADKVAKCNDEIAKLGATTAVAYFADVKDAAGNAVALKDILGTEDLNVYEFVPVVTGNFDENIGDVTATLLFATPYAADAKVVVMIGLVNGDVIDWTALEGTVNADGAVEVVFPAALVAAIQNGTALLAVVSK